LDNMMEMDARSPVSFVLDSSGCWMRMEIISSMEREWGKTWHWRLAGSRRTNPS